MILKDYKGSVVRLTPERQEHFNARLRLAGMQDFVAETLGNPDVVVESRSDETAYLNYRYYYGTKIGDKWLCVVVKANSDDAFVLTAYPTDRIKQGKLLWKKT